MHTYQNERILAHSLLLFSEQSFMLKLVTLFII